MIILEGGGNEITYSKQILNLFQEIAYLIHLDKQKGFLYMAEAADLSRFEYKLRPFMKHFLKVSKQGSTEENVKALLEIHMVEYFRDASYDANDLKLLKICLEAGMFLLRSDWDGLRLFAENIFIWEGNAQDIYQLTELLSILQKAVSELNLLMHDEVERTLAVQLRHSNGNALVKEEIDQLLNKNGLLRGRDLK